MTLKTLFGLGIGFAIAGLVLSLCPDTAVQLAGSAALLMAIVCNVRIAYATRKVIVDSSATLQKKKQMGIAWAFVCIAAVMALLVEFRWSSLSHYAASIMLFMLCIMLLLQQRAQGKIS